jgi:AcrR family transcriptional regulator
MKRSIDTEKRILQAALELIIRKGYHGTSIKDISSKSGLTKSAPYSHFRSKGELVLRLIEEYERQYVDELTRILEDRPGDAFDKLHHFISFNSKFGRENTNLAVFFIYISNELSGNADFQPALRRVERKQDLALRDLFRSAMRQGLLKKELNPDILAMVFTAICRGLFRKWASNRDYMDGTEYTRTFRTLFFKGIEV